MPKFKNETYNALKWLALVGLPALATLYFAMAGLWGWPNADKVVGSITAVDAALGLMLHLSSQQFYKDNTVAVVKTPQPPAGS